MKYKENDEEDLNYCIDGFDIDNEKISKAIDNLSKTLLNFWEKENDGIQLRALRSSILELLNEEISDFISNLEVSP